MSTRNRVLIVALGAGIAIAWTFAGLYFAGVMS